MGAQLHQPGVGRRCNPHLVRGGCVHLLQDRRHRDRPARHRGSGARRSRRQRTWRDCVSHLIVAYRCKENGRPRAPVLLWGWRNSRGLLLRRPAAHDELGRLPAQRLVEQVGGRVFPGRRPAARGSPLRFGPLEQMIEQAPADTLPAIVLVHDHVLDPRRSAPSAVDTTSWALAMPIACPPSSRATRHHVPAGGRIVRYQQLEARTWRVASEVKSSSTPKRSLRRSAKRGMSARRANSILKLISLCPPAGVA